MFAELHYPTQFWDQIAILRSMFFYFREALQKITILLLTFVNSITILPPLPLFIDEKQLDKKCL